MRRGPWGRKPWLGWARLLIYPEVGIKRLRDNNLTIVSNETGKRITYLTTAAVIGSIGNVGRVADSWLFPHKISKNDDVSVFRVNHAHNIINWERSWKKASSRSTFILFKMWIPSVSYPINDRSIGTARWRKRQDGLTRFVYFPSSSQCCLHCLFC